MKNAIVASTSTLHGGTSLEYLLDKLSEHFKNAKEIIFIPFARPSGISHNEYTSRVQKAFEAIEKKVIGLHTFDDPLTAIKNADAIFTGGGNTFLLVKQLYSYQIMPALRNVILNGTPYLGTSAGSNICGVTMQNTNDMPIVYPPSFKTLGILPFNINAHYLDPDPDGTHMGETRETRIKEYHTQNTVPVVGLREGSWLDVKGETTTLCGYLPARIFEQGKEAYELPKGSSVNF
jgi:dipeptidase E